jgi:hypothetical protein
MKRTLALLIVLLKLTSGVIAAAEHVAVDYDQRQPQLAFAASEIQRAGAAGRPLHVELTVSPATISVPQSYTIRHTADGVVVTGGDAAGAMYGGLDVAEAIRLGMVQELKAGEHKPFIAQRGIKFNIPLDLRTPSYSDDGDSAQANIPEMWSRDFWHDSL